VNPCYATIVSPNYLAYARVLGESLAEHVPGAHFQVLVVGREDASVRAACEAAGLSITFASGLGLPDFDELAYKFDIVELNTALKPTFLKSLFAQGFDSVVYLDPDIRLYQAPDPVTEALGRAEIVLIPHTRAPIMDGLRPSDVDFLRTGAYNLGFIGLRRGAEALALLDWWEARCLAHGFNDPGFGTFVDQKWLDLAPSYFDSVHVLKHEGCNVAYWNLHERTLGRDAGGWRVDAQPLVFFHFSGVDASAPHLLSRHQNRHVPSPGSPLAALVADYCARLLQAGHAQYKGLAYPFGKLTDGTAISPLMRRAATLPELDRSRPFEPDSPLQRTLREAGLTGGRTEAGKGVTTLNFDPKDRSVRAFNFLIRVMARIMGPERVGAMVRYATFLGWGGNFDAVLLKQPFQLRHVDQRKDSKL
jgi:hypothetical protein